MQDKCYKSNSLANHKESLQHRKKSRLQSLNKLKIYHPYYSLYEHF